MPRGGVSVKVQVDEQIFALQSHGGISRYFVELMQAFRSDKTLGVDLIARNLWTQNHHLVQAGMGRRLPTRLGRHERVIRAANRRHISRGRADLVHHTYYDSSYLSHYAKATRRVITVYDMIPEILPEMFPSGNPHRDKREFVDAADLILCISESTKNDLVQIYGEPSAPLIVTPLGVDPRFTPSAQPPDRIPERYILFVGNRAGYKDFVVLAEAFAEAPLPQDVFLLAVGGGPFGADEVLHMRALGISKRVIQTSLSDAELPGAYAGALCFVFPSRYEGFGLPTLEAMATGCPTILAASSSHPEVGGDAALYFPPSDAFRLSQILADLVPSPELRGERRTMGLTRSAGFSWRRTAQATANAYRQICSQA